MTFPSSWICEVTVLRSGGKDPRGNPLPATEHTEPDCLVASEHSDEVVGSRSDSPETTAWVYAPVSSDFISTDAVVVPAGPWPSGRFQVDGEPRPTPLGTVVPLKR